MQAFVIAMFVLVVAGTVYDILHKRSARYFFENWKKSKSRGKEKVSGGQILSALAHTAIVDVMTSGEFCNMRRRMAHLLTMYGFVAFVVSTAVLVFCYPTELSASPWTQLWHIGATMVCIGGYWFWFFIRVDVAAEGHSPFRIVRADLFVLSLLACTTLALIWSYLQNNGHALSNLFFALHLFAALVLFGAVPWSKFAHMFFKPAAALEKRISEMNGTRHNLPAPSKNPETLGKSGQRPRNY